MVRHKGFPGGAILPNDKDLTEGLKIEETPVPSSVQVVLDDGAGGTAEPSVLPGQKVSPAQCIALPASDDGVRVHSPIWGQVRQIEQVALANGTLKSAITIDSGEVDGSISPVAKPSWKVYSEGLIKCLRWGGIVQMQSNGGSLVSRVRRALKAGLRWVIINGVESEPLITCEARIMSECAGEIAQGCELLAEVFGLSGREKKSAGAKGVVALCGARHKSLSAMRKALKGGRFRLAALADVFPQDEEVLLANSLTNTGLRGRCDPADAGVLIINVSSVLALSRAWYAGKIVTDRVVTVGGDGSERIGNYLVPIGSSVADLAKHVGVLTEASTYILGGPFRGWSRGTLEGVITKETTGLIILSSSKRQSPQACIRCGWCTDDCPAQIDPVRLYRLIEAGKLGKAKSSFLDDCIECGLCSYVCPTHLPLLEKIRLGKWSLAQPSKNDQGIGV